MYLPPHFTETDSERLRQTIASAGLVTIVTATDEGLEASHIPLHYDPTPAADGSAPFGTLYGHLAKTNEQWRRFRTDIDALAIFQGPDAYITPSWYVTKQETGKVVPTWNYVAIHAYGRLKTFDDAPRLLDLVTRLTQRHEKTRSKPWSVQDAPADYIAAMLKGIVGLELPISRLEGKWKMSQNRSAADQSGVVTGLRDAGETEVAAVMAESTSR
ncbi:MAG TPA: FMN-binding negative transcriptional regulator [Terriglobia bacterium]|nr:FMN-binding negative transcriptional regulator [Terriglobia bacterium]